MKHIKRFNESVEQRIQDQCEAHLAYLLDEGYEVNYKPTGHPIQQRDFII